ncbi:MAG: prenyltransferase/squalene oxidase repeat-containing protein [Acutalibacteraceae bacterium]
MKKTIEILFVLLFIISSLAVTTANAADYSSYDFRTTANGIIKWKKAIVGCDTCLFEESFTRSISENAGGEWYACYMGRLGFEDYPQNYLNAITSYVTKKYNESGSLSETYATDYHKIALSVISAGGNPYNVGGVNLIADGVYNRENTASLGRQGMNGWVWGLIALDSLNTQVPDGSCYTREEIITEILKYQLKDGGFSIVPMASKSDVDITAMALYALAPYRYDSTAYTYVPRYNKNGKAVTKTAGQVIDAALSFLSNSQRNDGSYESYGVLNSESISQVIIALCSLGIDPQNDPMFIKDKSLLNSFMSFRQRNGGFAHKLGEGSDAMASEQALGAVAALDRFYRGQTRLFDFTDGVTMTVYKASSSAEQPTIPVPPKNNGTSSNGNNGSTVTSGNNATTTNTPSAPNNSISSHPSTASQTQGGTVTASEKATEKSTEKATEKPTVNLSVKDNNSEQLNDNSISDKQADSDNSNADTEIIKDNNDNSQSVNPFFIIVPTIVISAALGTVGFCFYKKKKKTPECNNDIIESEKPVDNGVTPEDYCEK